uniref:Uncharacterized protein n=1 Tax=Seriola lalandi dorsalis TaxID=1841481 RepID=A0A3B4X1G5_SERLL
IMFIYLLGPYLLVSLIAAGSSLLLPGALPGNRTLVPGGKDHCSLHSTTHPVRSIGQYLDVFTCCLRYIRTLLSGASHLKSPLVDL